MNSPLIFVVALLAACVAMFVIGKPRMDVVALFALVGLSVSGIVTPKEAMAGFGDPSVILIAAMFVLGEGLVRTGVAYAIGDWLIARAAGSETRLLVLLMLAAAGLGSVMSSTGVVAIFIPIVLRAARRMKVSPAKLLMPLAFSGLISGMLTLVATPPNLMVDSALKREGFAGMRFFAPTPIGLAVLAFGVGYMLFARKWLERPGQSGAVAEEQRSLKDLIEEYEVAPNERRVRIGAGSPLIGRKLSVLNLRQQHRVHLIAIERRSAWADELIDPGPHTVLAAGDILFIDRPQQSGGQETMSPTQADELIRELRLERLPLEGRYFGDHSRQIGMAEILIPPDSHLARKSVRENEFRRRHGLHVIGLRRSEKTVVADPLETPLKSGDLLLVIGPWKAIHRLQTQKRDFIVLDLPAEAADVVPAGNRATLALVTVLLVVGLMIFRVVPNVTAALIGCLLMGLFRCVDLTSAYRSIHWQSLVLIAGMMPFAPALEKTGGMKFAVDAVIGALGASHPQFMLAGLFLMTATMSLFISNTVTAVLMAPVAIAMARQMNASPLPFAMVVAIAASAAFITPVSSPVNTLVYGPGQYRFFDFVKVGVPFTLLVLVVTVILVPWLFPF